MLSCVWLCGPKDCSPWGSSVYGILQTRILEWAAIPSSRRPSQPRDLADINCVSCIAGRFFTTETWEAPMNCINVHKRCTNNKVRIWGDRHIIQQTMNFSLAQMHRNLNEWKWPEAFFQHGPRRGPERMLAEDTYTATKTDKGRGLGWPGVGFWGCLV